MSYTPQEPQGIQSSVNSTATPLASGATFTGVAELNDYSDVMTTVKSDTNGTLYLEFSTNGTDWDTSLSFKYNTSRINPPHILVKGSRYFRARFVNEGGTQTVFRLDTYYGSFEKLTSPINSTLAENFDALVTRPTDFHYEVAMGKRQGMTTWNKFGYNNDIDAAATECVKSAGGTHTILSAASTMSVVSTSVNDITGGTGTRSVIIYGLDSDWNEIIEVVSLNGTTPVTTTNSFIGINRVSIYLCGTLQVNDGTINVTATTGGSNQAQIPAGEGSTQQMVYYVPANHTALIDFLFLNINKVTGGGGAPTVTVKAWVYASLSNAKYEVFRDTIDSSVENHIELIPSQPFVVGEKQVIYFEATTDINNTVVAGRFSLIAERNI